MKYYLIAGEASGDLHASHLMEAIKRQDQSASFRFYGGDLMAAVGGTCVKHYRELAYMGFVPVLLHLPTILKNLSRCQRDILDWQPDRIILVDYPGFNLKVAKYVHRHTSIPIIYYISPKIWAWKEYRIKAIKRDIDRMLSILPFEPAFYRKHGYSVHYVGNPTLDEVRQYQKEHTSDRFQTFVSDNAGLHPTKPLIALLAGSRKQEIKDNLPDMLKAILPFLSEYQAVIAGAPGISPAYYERFAGGVPVIFGQTYRLLSHASAALVTSGTATLETALFGVPQVVCYHTPIGKVIAWLRRHILKTDYISLVNLIADREVVRELVADTMTVLNMHDEMARLLTDSAYRAEMQQGYQAVEALLGTTGAACRAAAYIIS
ncbi:MAG: lipid-A-disaccharide synthase [Prevotellaceae bacterium]|jgi:lipid-A-disaccharide synthase|nr:lipid-A-disaccharide synthase [Prevotellaceae bacterium]